KKKAGAASTRSKSRASRSARRGSKSKKKAPRDGSAKSAKSKSKSRGKSAKPGSSKSKSARSKSQSRKKSSSSKPKSTALAAAGKLKPSDESSKSRRSSKSKKDSKSSKSKKAKDSSIKSKKEKSAKSVKSAKSKSGKSVKTLAISGAGPKTQGITIQETQLNWKATGGLGKFNLHNTDSTTRAFKVKTSDNLLYRVAPVYGVIKAGEKMEVQVMRNNGAAKVDKLVVLSMPVAGELGGEEAFKQPGANNNNFDLALLPLVTSS
ncbi:unnamed protein product, partial [Mesorhabditis spiculigera]